MDGTWSTSCSSSHRRSRRGKCAARPPPRAVLTLPPRAVLALPPRAPASAPRTTARAPPRTTARPVPPPRCSHRGRAPTHGAFARVAHTQVVCGVISVRRVRGSAVWVCGGRGGSRVRAGTGQVGWSLDSGHVGGVGDRTSCAWSRVRSRVPSSVPDQSPALRAGPALLWPLRGWGPAFFGSPRSRVRKFSHEFSATKTESGWARGGADLRFVIGHMDIWIQHRCILTLCHKTHETCHAQSHSHRAERW